MNKSPSGKPGAVHGADTFVFATGDTGITLATVDRILDFTTADDTINVNDVAVAAGVTIADGAANLGLGDFLVDANAALTGGAGVYAEYSVGGFGGDGYVVVDEDASRTVNAGDTLIRLDRVFLMTDLVVADFA